MVLKRGGEEEEDEVASGTEESPVAFLNYVEPGKRGKNGK